MLDLRIVAVGRAFTLDQALAHPGEPCALREISEVNEAVIAKLDDLVGDPDLEDANLSGDRLDMHGQHPTDAGLALLLTLPVYGIDQTKEPINAGAATRRRNKEICAMESTMTATDDVEVETAFAEWRALMGYLNGNAAPDEAMEEFDRLSVIEEALLHSKVATPRIAEIRLWIGLHHMMADRRWSAAVIRGDVGPLLDRIDDLEGNERFFVKALAALVGQRAVG